MQNYKCLMGVCGFYRFEDKLLNAWGGNNTLKNCSFTLHSEKNTKLKKTLNLTKKMRLLTATTTLIIFIIVVIVILESYL